MGVFALQTQEYSDFFDKKVKGRKQSQENSSNYGISSRLKNISYTKSLTSKDPQAVMKIISTAIGQRQVKNVMDYICREKELEKLECEDDQGRVFSGADERNKLIEEWKQDFLSKESYDKQAWKLDELHKMEERLERLGYKKEIGQITKTELSDLAHLEECISEKFKYNKDGKKVDLKMRGVADTTHILFSVGGKPDVKKATEATRNFLQENLKGAGFRYVMVTHNDTNNLHFHVVVHNHSLLEKSQRLYFDKADLFVLRKEYARHLKSFGIKRESTLRKDRPNVLEGIQKGIENIRERNTWFQTKILNNSKNNKNAYTVKTSMLRQIESSIKKIEYESKFIKGGDKVKLQNSIKELQKIKKDITKAGEKSFERVKNDAIKYLVNQDKLLAKKLEKTDNNNLTNKNKQGHLNEFLKKHRQELKEARDYLTRNAKVKTDQERRDLKESLNILSKLISNSKSKALDR